MQCSHSFPSSSRYSTTPSAASPSPRSASSLATTSRITVAFGRWMSRGLNALRRMLAILRGRKSSTNKRKLLSKQSTLPSLRVFLLFLPQTILLTSCAENPPPAEIKVVRNYSGCKAFKPITFSKQDTRGTVDQIIEYGAVRKKLCN